MSKKSGGNIWIMIGFVLILVFFCAIISIGGGSSGSSHSRTCKSCGKSYTDSANTLSIAKTGMCENCYGNFEWGMKATGKW